MTVVLTAENAETDKSLREFNLFLDSGPISEKFLSATSELAKENTNGRKFSVATMRIGDSFIYIDGKRIETTQTASKTEDGQLFLPAKELIEMTEATIDCETRRFIVEKDNQRLQVEVDNSIADGAQLSESQAEQLLVVDIRQEGDRIFITRPYQTKTIVLFVRGGGVLYNTYMADTILTNGHGLYFLQYLTEEQTKLVYEAFLNDNTIQYVTVDTIHSISALPAPGSWGTNGNENSVGIQADRMKNYVQTLDDEIIVAVLDTGVDSEYLPNSPDGRDGHPHVADRTTVAISNTDDTAGYNYIDNNNNPYDVHGHGTHVAGTIIDCTPNNVKIMPVKVLGDDGYGTSGSTWSSVASGMIYAADHGAKVVNMSLGASCQQENCLHRQALEAINITAASRGISPPIFVVAAGNEKQEVQNSCPARFSNVFDNVITVAAVDEYDLQAGFSNYGEAIDVCAPGTKYTK